jgi:hypothetical protein
MTDFKLVPVEDRVFSTQEIADALGTTRPTIYRIAAAKNLHCSLVHGKVKVWSYDDFKVFKLCVSQIQKHKPVEPVKKPELTLEEMQKLHPLVTNPRWFKLSAFPDVTPQGYEDMESVIFGR